MSMTNGNMYSCDNDTCTRTEFVNRWDMGLDEGPRGWIMMAMNEPRDYGWRMSKEVFSPMKQGPSDYCSIECAREQLQRAMAATYAVETAEA